MTKEDQIDWLCRLKADLNNGVIFTPWNKEFTEALTGILEQEPILDKIRAEIDTARFIDKDTKLCKNANASGLEVAMQIIDKYKAESEE